jgi:hypothetical protein
MAFDLVARLRVKDDMSAKMRRIERQVGSVQKTIQKTQRATQLWRDANGRLRDSMGRFAAETKKANASMKGFGNSLKSAGGFAGSAASRFTALAAAIGGVVAAKKTFESTVLAAAQREQSTIMINAMINDKKISKQYMDLIDRISVKSPIMNSKDMLENSKSFLSVTKDIKQLEKMWNLAERMAAIDPAQGVEGAVYALRELFSGDAVSMVERFELPRKVMNEIKKLPIEKQLAALDKYFNRIGWTTKVVDDMGNSTLGLWRRVNEQFQLVLAKMGEPSLKVLKGFFSNILEKLESGELNRFTEIGAKMIKNILSGLTNGITSIYNWFSAVTNSEEFKQKTTLTGKIAFIFDDLYKKFTQWLDASGQKQINDVASKIIDVLGTAVESAAPRIAAVVMTVGASVGQALVSGAANYIRNNFWSYITSAIPSAFSAKKIGGKVLGLMFGKGGGGGKKSKKSSDGSYNPRLVKGYAGGLNYVPYDRFPAFLHRGEMVLPRGEAQEYRKNKGRVGGGGVTIHIENMHVRNDHDIKRIAYDLARLIEREGHAIAISPY